MCYHIEPFFFGIRPFRIHIHQLSLPSTVTLNYIQEKNDMSTVELQDALNLYAMITFWDGRKEPGLLISRYNIPRSATEYYFVAHDNMHHYKNALERFDRETYLEVSEPVDPQDVIAIHPVSLSEYKSIMQQSARNQRQQVQ